MRPLGLLLIFIALAVPVPAYWQLAGQHDPIAVFSQYLGSASLIAMGINQLLATRFTGVQALFGGLDRVYVLHKWLAVGAVGAAALHDTIDAEIDALGPQTLLNETAETLGEIGFYGLLLLVFASIIPFIPYHLWKWTHRFMGAFFAMAAAHYLFIQKPFANTDALGLYVAAFCLVGIASYLYMLLLHPVLPGPKRYAVTRVDDVGDAVAIEMQPVGRGIRHQAGQFAFVGFDHPELSELHPFTIAGSDGEKLRFAVKGLGAYTRSLGRKLEAGMNARVYGGYGHFNRVGKGRPEVWIAAGIGVTPFLAWIADLSGKATDAPVVFFYCVRTRAEAYHLDLIEAAAAGTEGLDLFLIESARDGRLSAERIVDTVSAPIAKHDVYFCGPIAMRQALRHGLAAHGLPASRFHFEEFEIRSGVGLRAALGWLISRISGNDAAKKPGPV